MGTVKITRVEDIQPGDRVTLVYNADDATVSGIVRLAVTVLGRVRLEVGDTPFWLGNGTRDWHVTAATREVPDAPPCAT